MKGIHKVRKVQEPCKEAAGYSRSIEDSIPINIIQDGKS